ncbi:hypothetical protein Tco_0153469 [Tanacetum coccineum]
MIINSTNMVALESYAKHNMVAYLEKTDGNTKFYKIIDFLTRSSIYYALTVSPVVFTTFVEQFWMSAKSKIINNVRYITAKVAGKPVNISKSSIRKGSGGNPGGQSSNDRSLSGNEDEQLKPIIHLQSTKLNMSGTQDEIPPPPPPPPATQQTPTQQTPHTVSTIKLPIDPKDKGKKVLEEEAESDAESEALL